MDDVRSTTPLSYINSNSGHQTCDQRWGWRRTCFRTRRWQFKWLQWGSSCFHDCLHKLQREASIVTGNCIGSGYSIRCVHFSLNSPERGEGLDISWLLLPLISPTLLRLAWTNTQLQIRSRENTLIKHTTLLLVFLTVLHRKLCCKRKYLYRKWCYW